MKFSIFLPTGFAREFTAIADPRTAYEKVVQVARVADAARSRCLARASAASQKPFRL